MFSDQLAKLRKTNKLTQKELADVLQCSTSRIGMYEQGRRQPDLGTLEILADYFHVSTDYLIGRKKNVSVIRETPAPYMQESDQHPLIQYIEQRLIHAGLLAENQDVSIDDMMLFVRFGETAAVEIIKERRTRT